MRYTAPPPRPPEAATERSIVAGFAVLAVLMAGLVAVDYPVEALTITAAFVILYVGVRWLHVFSRWSGTIGLPGTEKVLAVTTSPTCPVDEYRCDYCGEWIGVRWCIVG